MVVRYQFIIHSLHASMTQVDIKLKKCLLQNSILPLIIMSVLLVKISQIAGATNNNEGQVKFSVDHEMVIHPCSKSYEQAQ